MIETVATRVVGALAAYRRAAQLYPPGHPAHEHAAAELVSAVSSATIGGRFTLAHYQGRIYHENEVLPHELTPVRSIAHALEARRISSLVFDRSFSASDALALAEVLSLRPTPDLDVGAELERRGVSGVSVAVVADASSGCDESGDEQRARDRALYEQALSALQSTQDQLSRGAPPDLASTTGLIGRILERLLADTDAVLGLATITRAGDGGLVHSLNVAILSLVIGVRLELPDEGLLSLGLSALLHDVGKSAFDRTDPAHAALVRELHPTTGAEMLERCALDDPAPMLVAFEHHMGAAGGGWPARHEGYVPHPYSRIVAIANRYSRLVDPGDGSSPLTPDRALAQVLREARDGVLDETFARLFASALGAFPIGCLVRLEDHRVGIVSKVGDDPLSPVVRVIYDERGTELDRPYLLDLSAATGTRIVEVIEPGSLAIAVSDKL